MMDRYSRRVMFNAGRQPYLMLKLQNDGAGALGEALDFLRGYSAAARL